VRDPGGAGPGVQGAGPEVRERVRARRGLKVLPPVRDYIIMMRSANSGPVPLARPAEVRHGR